MIYTNKTINVYEEELYNNYIFTFVAKLQSYGYSNKQILYFYSKAYKNKITLNESDIYISDIIINQ